MLLEFSVKNFYSFKEKTTFSMIASSDKNHESNYVEFLNEKINVLKVGAIYGANASGKTNLMKVLSNVSNMIRISNSMMPDQKLPIIPFKLDENTQKRPSEFEIKFILDNVRYFYSFVADSDKIYEESLFYSPNGRMAKIFERKNIDVYTFSSDNKILNDIKTKNTPNKFFLSSATNWNYEKTKPAFDFLTNKLGVVISFEHVKNYSFDKYYTDKSNVDKNLENFTLNLLKKADFNISGYKVIEEKMTKEVLSVFPDFIKEYFPENTPMYKINTIHELQGQKFELDITEESLGTQIIFSLIPVFKDVIENTKVLIIDELDRSLHTHLLEFIVELFNSPIFNKTNSQLIFNTHDTNLLNLDVLRRDQIWFIEKNYEDASSALYPLDDFKVRANFDIEKSYLLGRYGAVPYIDKDVIGEE